MSKDDLLKAFNYLADISHGNPLFPETKKKSADSREQLSGGDVFETQYSDLEVVAENLSKNTQKGRLNDIPY
ncbi:MAG: hypothetical protein LBC14_01080 [Desulfovibrio sp.]|nr:hypothetical protein [Desulfovibrio sp.]